MPFAFYFNLHINLSQMKPLFFLILVCVAGLSCQKSIDLQNQVIGLPTLVTTAATSITSSSAASGGNINADGGAAVTARGICWSTLHNPDITGNHTTDGTGTGAFASNIATLTASTTYYARAYATNSAGTAYGNEISFNTTNAPTALPTVTTAAITLITATTASGGGNVTADGGAVVTARGICWGTVTNPVVTGNHTTDGSGTGVFVSALTALSPNTVYYVRAYATNNVGTAYGSEVSFTSSTVAVTSKLFYVMENFVGGILSYEIYSSDIDGTNEQRLTNFSNNGTLQKWATRPIFNVDSSKIIFNLGTNSYDATLMSMNLDGSNATAFAPAIGSGISNSVLYQNGQKLLFTKDTIVIFTPPNQTHVRQLFTANVDGTNIVKLTDYTDDAFAGDINLSSNKVIYHSLYPPAPTYSFYEIKSMNIDGTNKIRLTTNTTSKAGAKFSPDGSKIVYYSGVSLPAANGHREVFIMNADGTNIIQLTNYSNNGALGIETYYPVFSKNGNTIYYSSTESGTGQIYKMNIDGSGKVKITTGAGTGDKYNPLVK